MNTANTSHSQMYEKALLNKALSVLKKNTDVESVFLEVEGQPDHYPYLYAVVGLTKNVTTQKFIVYVERQPSIAQLGLQITYHRASQTDIKMLFVADYISPKTAQFLKESNCNFVDGVGNTFLEFSSIFIYMTGNKQTKSPSGTVSLRAFQPTGLKLIFALLCHPDDIISRNYRELSEISGVSLGSIGWIINDLKAAGYLSSGENDKRKWSNKESLIERWVVAYPEKLRSKLVLGYYRTLQESWQEGVKIESFGALWGGEIAADHLTGYLKPEFSTVYTDEQLGKLVLLNGLKEVPDKNSGNVEVLQKFWQFENPEKPYLVPALLIYADLIASGDSRNLETARIIYKDYLNVTE